jgi:hypothetical protein
MRVFRIHNHPVVGTALYAGVMTAIIWVAYAGGRGMDCNWQWYRVLQYLFAPPGSSIGS